MSYVTRGGRISTFIAKKNFKKTIKNFYKPRTQAIRIIPHVVQFADQNDYSPENIKHMIEIVAACESLSLALQVSMILYSMEQKKRINKT
jgi:hypothetical protein